MTRENKLALVTGFALILLVGILLSDHFSAASTETSADLLPVRDPLAAETRTDPELLRFQPPRATTAAWTAPDARAAAGTDAARPPVGVIRTPDLQAAPPEGVAPAVALPPADAARLPWRFHEVQPGESLTSICTKHFGDASLARELAAFNGLDDPDRLAAGARLRIPAADDLVRGAVPGGAAAAPAAMEPAKKASATSRTYTVKPGDVLSVIASRELGSAKRWRELYEANRDVIDDPDHVEVGVVLDLP